MTPRKPSPVHIHVDYPVSLVSSQWLTNLAQLQAENISRDDVYRLATALLMPVPARGKLMNSHNIQVALGYNGSAVLQDRVQALVKKLPSASLSDGFKEFQLTVQRNWPNAETLKEEILPLLLQVQACGAEAELRNEYGTRCAS